MTKLVTVSSSPLAQLDDRTLGRQLTDQYRKATAGMMEYLAFGALAMHARDRAEKQRAEGEIPSGGKAAAGTGLKAWLEEFAPEVARATADRLIDMAEGVRAEFKIGAKTDLYSVLKATKPSTAEKKLRLKISAFVEGKSQRQLLIGFGKFQAKQGGARTTTKKVSEEQRREAWLTLAKQSAKSTVSELHELGDRWQLLDDKDLRLAATEAAAFAARAEKWLKTPVGQRAAFDLDQYIKSEEQK